MRVHFTKGGHIVAPEDLPGLNDEQAMRKVAQLYAARVPDFDGFEIWDGTRMVAKYPPVVADGTAN